MHFGTQTCDRFDSLDNGFVVVVWQLFTTTTTSAVDIVKCELFTFTSFSQRDKG